MVLGGLVYNPPKKLGGFSVLSETALLKLDCLYPYILVAKNCILIESKDEYKMGLLLGGITWLIGDENQFLLKTE